MLASPRLCPVSKEYINSWQVRATALLIFLLTAIILYFQYEYWLLYLIIDFGSRGFTQLPSLLSIFSKKIIAITKLAPKWEDKAPKKFAAKIGFVVTTIALLAYLVNLAIVAQALLGLILLFSLLEGGFAICVGCYIYSWLVNLGWVKV